MIQPEDLSKELPKLYFPLLQRNNQIHWNCWDTFPSSITPHKISLRASASGRAHRCSYYWLPNCAQKRSRQRTVKNYRKFSICTNHINFNQSSKQHLKSTAICMYFIDACFSWNLYYCAPRSMKGIHVLRRDSKSDSVCASIPRVLLLHISPERWGDKRGLERPVSCWLQLSTK